MPDFDDKHILVVGGAGFVGSNLIKLLIQNNVKRITIVDNLLSSEKSNIPNDSRIVFVEGSITDDKILEGLEDNIDYIFHLATYHGNQSSIHDPLADHENNMLTTLKLLNHIKLFKNIKKFIYSSAGCSVAKKTFDEAKATTEDDPISLIQDSPYSISKVIGEFYSVYFFRQHGIPSVRARFQNVYGPGEILGAGKWRGTSATVWRNVVPTFIYKALNGQPLPLENEGKASRDFIYVNDVCRGLIACALHGKPGDVYNIASGEEVTIYDLATKINELANNENNIEFLPKRWWDNSGKRFGSTAKANKELGFRTKTLLKEGLNESVKWTRDNISFIQQCIDKHNRYMGI